VGSKPKFGDYNNNKRGVGMNFDYKRLADFEVNIGEKEKKIRLIAGSVLLFISLFTASIILLAVGLVLVATGYSRVCPAYSALGKSTCETNEGSEQTEPSSEKAE